MSTQTHDEELLKSVVTSLLVCIPTFLLSVYIIQDQPAWWPPVLTTLAILGLSAANFAMIVFLEHYRGRIGKMTFPALLGSVGVVMIFVIVESINRFVRDVDYEWLFPIVAAYLLISFIAIFREKLVFLKLHLGINSVVIAVLWTLGVADKIALPF